MSQHTKNFLLHAATQICLNHVTPELTLFTMLDTLTMRALVTSQLPAHPSLGLAGVRWAGWQRSLRLRMAEKTAIFSQVPATVHGESCHQQAGWHIQPGEEGDNNRSISPLVHRVLNASSIALSLISFVASFTVSFLKSTNSSPIFSNIFSISSSSGRFSISNTLTPPSVIT